MRFRVRTLHIFMGIGPPLLYVSWLYSELVSMMVWAMIWTWGLIFVAVAPLIVAVVSLKLRWQRRYRPRLQTRSASRNSRSR